MKRHKSIGLSFNLGEKGEKDYEKMETGLKRLIEREDVERMEVEIRVRKVQALEGREDERDNVPMRKGEKFIYGVIKAVLEGEKRRKSKEIELQVSYVETWERRVTLSEEGIREYFREEMGDMGEEEGKEYVERIKGFMHGIKIDM
jgi:hypothetical protein